MNKTASPQDITRELRTLLAYLSTPCPNRTKVASKLAEIAGSLVTASKNEWSEKGGKWLSRVEYAGGEKHEWSISEDGDNFKAKVKTPKGSFECKKSFDDLAKAQRYCDKFITRADGDDMLQDALGKDFTKV